MRISEQFWEVRVAFTLKELRTLSDAELEAQHDNKASSTEMGLSYYLDEMRARQQTKINEEMRVLTKRIYWLTVVVTIATICNLAPLVIQLIPS